MGRALAGHPLVLLALIGCGAAPGPADRGARGDDRAPPSRAAAAAPTPREALDEASARRILAGRFRAAGFRILEDVAVEAGGVSLVADGFDPARRVGYEYIAAEERDLELDGGERERLAAATDLRILVAEESSAGELQRAADAFLAELPR